MYFLGGDIDDIDVWVLVVIGGWWFVIVVKYDVLVIWCLGKIVWVYVGKM